MCCKGLHYQLPPHPLSVLVRVVRVQLLTWLLTFTKASPTLVNGWVWS